MYRAQFQIKEREPKILNFQKKKSKLEKIIFTSAEKSPKILRISRDLKLENKN